jgi:hypothetical protein
MCCPVHGHSNASDSQMVQFARFCVRGYRQREGIDHFDTYARVVNWQTVRLMLVLFATVVGPATKQAD